MTKNELPDLIKVVLTNETSSLTDEEIHNRLRKQVGYEVSQRKVRETLRDMEDSGILQSESESDGTRGRPSKSYYIPHSGNGPKIERRGDVVASHLPDGMFWSIVERQMSTEDLVAELKEAAPHLADQNPVDLLTQMVNWTVEEINNLGEEISRLAIEGKTDQVRVIRDDYDDLAQWATRYFHKFWQITRYDDPGPDLLTIPESSDIIEAATAGDDIPKSDFDESGVREKFTRRVFGDSVLSTVEVDANITDAVGADASVAETSLPSSSSFSPNTSYQLFAGAAALDHEDRRFTDFDFNPENFKQYRHREAFRNGLIIAPNTTHQLGDGEAEKSRYAAMDLRQYIQAKKIIDDDEDVSWVPHGDVNGELEGYTGPDVMYLDGRLTPLVHQMSDFTANGLYGDLARREIREFAKVVDLTKDDSWQSNSTLAGIVKSPAKTWLSPLVFWYVETQLYDDRETDRTRVYRPPIPDDRLPHLLFAGLTDEWGSPSEDEIYTTFRVLRRFYDHSIPENDLPPEDIDGNPIDVDSREGWMSFFEMTQERKREFDIDTIDIDKFMTYGFAELCANVGTLMAYAGPPNLYQRETYKEARLPRIDLLASPPEDKADDMKQVLSLYAQKNYPDDAHARNRGNSELDDVPVIVPDVIVSSDQVAKQYRDQLSEDVRRDILDLVGALNGE